MTPKDLAEWEENFCIPFYRGKCQDANTLYIRSQEFYSRCCQRGEAMDLKGIYATSCGTPWAGLNLGFVSEPIRRSEVFRPRLERALSFYKDRSLPWILVIPDKWVAPGHHSAAEEVVRDCGFQLAMEARAISADRLRPLRAAPLAIEPASAEEDWATIASINAKSWDVPVDWILPLLGSSTFEEQAKGWLGRVEGQAVSAVVTFPLAPFTFCAWGATVPAFRKRGYGDFVTRHGAGHSGMDKPLFAISGPQGLATWLAAGFEQRDRFRLYLAPA